MNKPKASIITVCFNSEKTISQTINSVNKQSYEEIEHIFVDGLSTDSTVDIIRTESRRARKILSERDNGIYDAMNKGFTFASGEFVTFLNSDDTYADENIVRDVAAQFLDNKIDFVYGNIHMLNEAGLVLREWKTGIECETQLIGRQIPHPALFIRRSVLARLGQPFDASLKISADLKQQLLLVNRLGCKGRYVDRNMVNMKIGGASTRNIFAYSKGWRESRRVYNDVIGSGGTFFVLQKILNKLSLLILRELNLRRK